MKSARTFSQNQKQNCGSHQYCVHQHYQKCKKQRQRQINFTIFPNQNINAYNNAHIKSTNQYSYNFQTLAYEKYVKGKQPETSEGKSFVKNYYLQNVPQKMQMTNQIVKQLENDVFPFNAYNLADGATKDYYAFQMKRQQYLITARRRAKNNSNAFGKSVKILQKKEIEQRAKWINRILVTMEDLGNRMFGLTSSNKQNQSQNGKQRIFLNQKQHINTQYLKQYKIQNTDAAKNIFQDLRAAMLKQKVKFDDLRIQNKNISVQTSFMGQNSNASSEVSQSMISGVSQSQKQETDEDIINNLCDFQQLKKKWKVLDVQRIKDMILSSLTRKVILNCEGEKAKQIATYQRQCKSIPSKLKEKQNKENKKQKRSQTQRKKQTRQLQYKPVFKQKLSKQEVEIKQNWLKSSNLQSMGSKYQKIKNLSNLFKKKENGLRLNLSFISNQKQVIPQTAQKDKRAKFFAGNESFVQQTKSTMNKGYKTTRGTTSYLRI